jgi:hypothetical protein
MKMPHGYTLLGEGRAGAKIEPPRGRVALRADNPYAGDHFEQSQPALSGPKLDEHDTQGVLAPCDQAIYHAEHAHSMPIRPPEVTTAPISGPGSTGP